MKTAKRLIPLLVVILAIMAFGCFHSEKRAVKKAIKNDLDLLKNLDSDTASKYFSYKELFPDIKDDQKQSNEIKDVFEENLEWDIHLYKNAIIPIITNNEVKDVFPNKKGESSVVLLLSKIIRENISNLNLKEDDIIYFEKEEFNKLLLDLRKENGHGFTKTLREYSDELYIHTIKEYMKSFSMLDIKDNLVLILPLMGKIIGDYPKDYKEKINEQ